MIRWQQLRKKLSQAKKPRNTKKKKPSQLKEQRAQNTEPEGPGDEVDIFADRESLRRIFGDNAADTYMNICENGINPQTVLESMNDTDKANVEVWLRWIQLTSAMLTLTRLLAIAQQKIPYKVV